MNKNEGDYGRTTFPFRGWFMVFTAMDCSDIGQGSKKVVILSLEEKGTTGRTIFWFGGRFMVLTTMALVKVSKNYSCIAEKNVSIDNTNFRFRGKNSH